jgi:hypothetical protein
MLKKRILLENNNFDKNEFKLKNLNKNLHNESFKKNFSKEKNDEIFISKISNDNNNQFHFNTTFRKHINIIKEINVSEFTLFSKRKFSQLNKNGNENNFQKFYRNNI